jgi:glucose-6-phosphate isomerase
MTKADSPPSQKFSRYLRWRVTLDDPFLELDLSHTQLAEADLERHRGMLVRALEAMDRLERGAIANADENRMVGHYWLRAPGRAPTDEISEAIAAGLRRVEEFATAVHARRVRPPEGGAFTKLVLIGIGGSALGPMWLFEAFAHKDSPMRPFVLDNTDPDGIDRMLAAAGSLQDALVVVISKSGGTPETRNGMLEVHGACVREGLSFARRAVAVTGEGSALHEVAKKDGWLATFPMWDWVGGRTSVTSAVGLLPGALLGMDVRGFLAGAAAMDDRTREPDPGKNPAALLALYWHQEARGQGQRDMVVLPYKDRLLLCSRYLQQLVMESLGKELDRHGKAVHQGLAVYGNKGSTDQHAYVQQLRDGVHNFFVVFVRVLQDRASESVEVEPGATSGDFLDGFWQGTRRALFEKGRASATITLEQVEERSLGALIALFERTVGIYGELVDVNAYHQPGVEAGKKAAKQVLELQARILAALAQEPRTCAQLAEALEADPADVWPTLRHLGANRSDLRMSGGPDPLSARFSRA